MKAINFKGRRESSSKRSERIMTIKIVLLFILFDFVLVYAASAAGIEMTMVKGGTFKMGNQFEEMFEDELPVHDVTLSDYFIGTYEVTQSEWLAVMGANPSQVRGDLSKPVESITWFDAINFCNKLSEKEGFKPCYTIGRNNHVAFDQAANGYRLPTEAEWEYAAKGGSHSKGYVYAGSNNLDEVAWYKDNSTGSTHVTGLKKPNELGLYDMSGNVWEWCWDWYGNSYNDVMGANPTGVAQGVERCRRGGGWHIISKSCRNSNRLGTPPQMSFNYVGLRLVRNGK